MPLTVFIPERRQIRATRDIAEGETLLCLLTLVIAVPKEIEKRGSESWYYDHEVDCAVFYGWEPDFFKFANATRKEDFDV